MPMKIALSFLLIILCLLPPSLPAQSAEDWREMPDHMTGSWHLTGEITGSGAHHQVHAEWILDRQFLRIREETAPDAPKTEKRHEALWFLGSVSDMSCISSMDLAPGFLKRSAMEPATEIRFSSSLNIPMGPSTRRIVGIP